MERIVKGCGDVLLILAALFILVGVISIKPNWDLAVLAIGGGLGLVVSGFFFPPRLPNPPPPCHSRPVATTRPGVPSANEPPRE